MKPHSEHFIRRIMRVCRTSDAPYIADMLEELLAYRQAEIEATASAHDAWRTLAGAGWSLRIVLNHGQKPPMPEVVASRRAGRKYIPDQIMPAGQTLAQWLASIAECPWLVGADEEATA